MSHCRLAAPGASEEEGSQFHSHLWLLSNSSVPALTIFEFLRIVSSPICVLDLSLISPDLYLGCASNPKKLKERTPLATHEAVSGGPQNRPVI
jgi:hypothetical protein